MIKRTEIAEILEKPAIGAEVTVMGWVRAFRGNRFIALSDGSTINTLQIVVDSDNFDEELIKKVGFHACISATGPLVESQGAGQAVEVHATALEVLGATNLEEYPLQPKRQTMEFLRHKAHLRMRTNTFGAVFRIRHAVAFAIHKYFNDRRYYYMHTPIITGSDAEGAGEMFRVSTLDPEQLPKTEEGGIDWDKDFLANQQTSRYPGSCKRKLVRWHWGKFILLVLLSGQKTPTRLAIWQNFG